jgi:DNA ligase-associated metallophosphoesterase
VNLTVAGETLVLRADKTAYWPAGQTLFLADVHFGKPESFRTMGIPAIGETTRESLAMIERAMKETASKRLIVLGDFWHARSGKTAEVLQTISDWRKRHDSLDVRVVLGNHDFSAGSLPANWRFTIDHHPTVMGPFVLAHKPMAHPDGYVLSGHLHPAIGIGGRGRQNVKLPCFWFAESFAVLPAFGGYTGTSVIQPTFGDRVVGIVEGELLEVPVS